jgi:DNA-binding HxlR family transcriptional regulator
MRYLLPRTALNLRPAPSAVNYAPSGNQEFELMRKAGDIYDPSCSARDALGLIASKWAMLILPALADGPMRNAQLLRKIGGISQKVLTQTLRDLERNGLIVRKDMQTRPRHVEYQLSRLGVSLSRTLTILDRWAERNFPQLDAARARYDAAARPDAVAVVDEND